ncbi:MAG: family N-acetyltransferase [Ferruginibacter sp.]|nr:family N-acetyltransferase [Ferruginibacter sp.]
MKMQNSLLRDILPKDNAAIAAVIRGSLEDFNAVKPGTVYFDETTDRLSEVFTAPRSRYFVVEEGGEVIGGAGIFPTQNLPVDTCELVKLYLRADARGKGLGKMLMQACENAAKENGFTMIYLETLPELNIAIPLYEKMGYTYLDKPLGETGHHGCDIWMIKAL